MKPFGNIDQVDVHHFREIGRLRMKMHYRNGALADMTLSRDGDQRDEGAGYIAINDEETRGLAQFMRDYYRDET